MKKTNSILTLLLTLSLSAFSQTNDVATLSKGRYIEVFENDTLQRIGSVMFNTVSNKIEYFIEESDSVVKQSTESSRWMSMDPLAAKYPSMSPYNFVANNPILLVDIDGRDFIVKNTAAQQKTTAAFSIIFNNSSAAFSFDKKGKLLIDRTKIHGELSADQRFILDKIEGLATDNTIQIKIKFVKEGGNYTDIPDATRDENAKPTEAKIYININHPLLEAKLNDTDDGTLCEGDPNYKPTDEEKTIDILGHEIGHISEDRAGSKVLEKTNDQKTVGFENVIRRILGLKEREGNLHGDNDQDGVYENKGKQEPSK